LVFAVAGFEDTFSPGVAVPPVEAAGDGEVGVFVIGIGDLDTGELENLIGVMGFVGDLHRESWC